MIKGKLLVMRTVKKMTPRDIASMEKKHHIYDVAMRLFQEYGYKNVTMKMISAESGISEGSIYNFFGEKAGITSLMTEQLQEKIYPAIEPTEENLKHPKKAIFNYMMAQSDAYESYGRDVDEVYLSTNLKYAQNQHYRYTQFMDFVAVTEPDLLEYLKIATEKKKIKCLLELNEFVFILASLGGGMLHSWISYGDGYSLHDSSEKVFQHIIDQYILEI